MDCFAVVLCTRVGARKDLRRGRAHTVVAAKNRRELTLHGERNHKPWRRHFLKLWRAAEKDIPVFPDGRPWLADVHSQKAQASNDGTLDAPPAAAPVAPLDALRAHACCAPICAPGRARGAVAGRAAFVTLDYCCLRCTNVMPPHALRRVYCCKYAAPAHPHAARRTPQADAKARARAATAPAGEPKRAGKGARSQQRRDAKKAAAPPAKVELEEEVIAPDAEVALLVDNKELRLASENGGGDAADRRGRAVCARERGNAPRPLVSVIQVTHVAFEL